MNSQNVTIQHTVDHDVTVQVRQPRGTTGRQPTEANTARLPDLVGTLNLSIRAACRALQISYPSTLRTIQAGRKDLLDQVDTWQARLVNNIERANSEVHEQAMTRLLQMALDDKSGKLLLQYVSHRFKRDMDEANASTLGSSMPPESSRVTFAYVVPRDVLRTHADSPVEHLAHLLLDPEQFRSALRQLHQRCGVPISAMLDSLSIQSGMQVTLLDVTIDCVSSSYCDSDGVSIPMEYATHFGWTVTMRSIEV